MGDATRTVAAKGQTSLGRDFFLSAATVQTVNAIAAPKGRSKMIEKSTRRFYRP